MKVSEFLSLARSVMRQGDAITEQLDAVVAGQPLEDQNPNALRIISFEILRELALVEDEELAEDAFDLMERIDTYLAERREAR
jgi:hypothetical protein